MLTFVTWNVQRKNMFVVVAEVVTATHADVLILIESQFIDGEKLLKALKNEFTEVLDPLAGLLNNDEDDGDGLDGEEETEGKKLGPSKRVFARKPIRLVPLGVRMKRVLPVKLEIPNAPSLLLAAVHLPAKGTTSDTTQWIDSSGFSAAIAGFEKTLKMTRTVVAGDFNMNPFEPGMTDFTAFNAVPTIREAEKITRVHNERVCMYYYNPSWRFFLELCHDGPFGTYYRAGSPLSWNVFDQVLIRPSLIKSFVQSSLRLITRAGSTSLLTKGGLPRKQAIDASDHLPFTFQLDTDKIPVAEVSTERALLPLHLFSPWEKTLATLQ